MTGDTIALYLLNGNQNPSLATRTLIKLFTDPSYNNDGVWRILTNTSIPAISGSSYLAIQYKTVNNWLDPRFDNLAVKGSGATDVSNIEDRISRIDLFQIQHPIWLSLVYRKTFTSHQSRYMIYLVNLLINLISIEIYSIENLTLGFYMVHVEAEKGTYISPLIKQ